jgi:hypothetical protein
MAGEGETRKTGKTRETRKTGKTREARKTGKSRETRKTRNPGESRTTAKTMAPGAVARLRGWVCGNGFVLCGDCGRLGLLGLAIVFSGFWAVVISFAQLQEVAEGALEHLVLTGLIALEKGELVGVGQDAEDRGHPMKMLSRRLGIDGLLQEGGFNAPSAQ